MSRWARVVLVLALLLVPRFTDTAHAQTPAQPRPSQVAPPPAPTMLLTVFLKHDQSKTLNEINEQLFRNGYYDKFPPEGIEVVSWYVVMGIGQVVTLRVPPDRLREVNVVLEQTAWGAYRTEFFPTYDYKQAAEQQRQTMRARKR
jgi:uncharacterized protein with GYD domain